MSDIEDLQRRAGIVNEQDDSQLRQVADNFARYVLGDGQAALRNLQALGNAGLGFRELSTDPADYNEVYDHIAKKFYEILVGAKKAAD